MPTVSDRPKTSVAPTPPEKEEYLSPAQFAQRLCWKVSETTIWRWAKNGTVQALNVGLGERAIYKIPASELARLEARIHRDPTDLTGKEADL